MIQEFIFKLIAIVGGIAVIAIVWEAIKNINSMNIRDGDDDHPVG